VCDRSCRFKCSSLANDRVHVVQMCGRGLSVFGGGKVGAGTTCDVSGFAVWMEVLLLLPLLPESSLGVLVGLARCVLLICEDMATWGAGLPAPTSAQRSAAILWGDEAERLSALSVCPAGCFLGGGGDVSVRPHFLVLNCS